MNTPLIMIVDDSDMDLFVTEKTLKYSGITDRFVICKNGAIALDYLKTNLTVPERLPDIIFLDINMPFVNGYAFMNNYEELPEAVKEKIKIIVLSSSGDNNDKENFVKNKYISYYMVKPLTTEELSLLKVG